MPERQKYSFASLVWIAEQLTRGRTQADVALELGVSAGALSQTVDRHLSIIYVLNDRASARADNEIQEQEVLARFNRKKLDDHIEQRNKLTLISCTPDERA